MNEHEFDARTFREGNPPLIASSIAVGPICRMCNKGTITRTRVFRMNTAGAVIGYLLLVLAAFWGILLITYLVKSRAPAGNELERAYESFTKGIAEAGMACFSIVALGGALAGWLLVRKKEVLKCSQCGVEVPRSLVEEYDTTRSEKGDIRSL